MKESRFGSDEFCHPTVELFEYFVTAVQLASVHQSQIARHSSSSTPRRFVISTVSAISKIWP
jgi:hypothetical protein